MKKSLFFFFFALLINVAVAQNTILWSIKSPNSDHSSFVLGTFHLMGNSFIDDKPIISELLSKSDMAIFECIQDRKKYIDDVMLSRPSDLTYEQALDKGEITVIEDLIKDWGIPMGKYTPAELFTRIQQKYVKDHCGTITPTDTAYHMDDYLQSIANDHKKKLMGLETYADQLYAINNPRGEEITWGKHNAVIKNFVNNQLKEAMCKSAKLYMKMKIDYRLKTNCAENDEILIRRNEKWLPQIIDQLEKNEQVFIAVGHLHLAGRCVIISQLREKGYIVKPVKIKH